MKRKLVYLLDVLYTKLPEPKPSRGGMIFFLLYFIFGALLTGSVALYEYVYPAPEPTMEITVYHDVSRVFWHERDKYSIFVPSGNPGGFKTVTLPRYACTDRRAEIITDVGPGESSWVRVGVMSNRGQGSHCFDLLEIHVPAIGVVQGADWNHSKQGSGQTISVH